MGQNDDEVKRLIKEAKREKDPVEKQKLLQAAANAQKSGNKTKGRK